MATTNAPTIRMRLECVAIEGSAAAAAEKAFRLENTATFCESLVKDVTSNRLRGRLHEAYVQEKQAIQSAEVNRRTEKREKVWDMGLSTAEKRANGALLFN